MSVDVILDISRLLARILHETPSGVDRVELASARGLLALMPDRLSFAAVHPAGVYGRLPTPAIEHYTGDGPDRAAQLARMAGWRRPEWSTHMRGLDATIGAVAA